MTSPGSPFTRFNRAIERRSVFLADTAARELKQPLPLDDAWRLVILYAEAGDPRFERAAVRWLARYCGEQEPRLADVRGKALELTRRMLA